MELEDVIEVLEFGFECSASKRKAEIIERCLKRDSKVLRVVVAEKLDRQPEGSLEEVYVLIHVSIETFKYGRFRNEGS